MARNAIKHYSQLTPGEQVVLVTGCCGTFGKAACPELLKSFRAVRGYDSMECPDALKLLPGFEFIRGRCEDGPAILDAVRGCNVVVHLAAVPGDADWMTALLPNNIISTVSLLRAIETVNMDVAEATAAMTGAAPLNRGKRQRTDHTLAPKYPIHRLILGSSGKMYDGHTGNIPITIATPISPICAFGASQAFIEAATKAFSADAVAGCVALSLRFGWCPSDASDVGEMRAASRRDGCGVDEFLSPADAAQAIRVACTAALQPAAAGVEQPRFVTAFVQSKSPPGRYQRFDTSSTVKLLMGWKPKDHFVTGTVEQAVINAVRNPLLRAIGDASSGAFADRDPKSAETTPASPGGEANAELMQRLGALEAQVAALQRSQEELMQPIHQILQLLSSGGSPSRSG